MEKSRQYKMKETHKDTFMEKLYKKKRLITLLTIVIALAMILSCIGILNTGSNGEVANAFTDAASVTSQSTELGKLLLDGYDSTGSGKIFDGEVFWPLVSLVTGITDPKESDLASWSTVRTASQFRSANSANGNLDLTVNIGGLSWTPTYLSYNTAGEPILTFWLASNATTAQWNTAYTNSLGKYPSNMYGTSYMRASILNNGGGYAAAYNATSLTAVSQSATSAWAIYTMDKTTSVGGSSIKEFIEVPDKVSWQHTQSAKTSAGQSYDFNNDALDSGGTYNANYNYYTNATVNVDSHASYQGWKNDTLWLPSVAETGAAAGEVGLWLTSANQRANSAYSWLRSAS